MICKHDQSALLGRADGILCRACGKTFKDYAEVEADRKKAEKPAPKPKTTAKKKTTTTEGKENA